MRRLALTLLITTLGTPTVFADTPASENFAIDPVHTRVMVAVEHAGFSRALGTVSGTTGHLQFAEGWMPAQVDVRIPLQRLDFGDAGWNSAVQRLLGAATFPEVHFVSTRVTVRNPAHAEACGDLTLHGVTHPACLDVTFNALKRHPMPPFRRTVGFSAVTHIDRTMFGITQWKSVIGSDVEIRIELEATRAAATTGNGPTPPVKPPADEAPTTVDESKQ